MGRTIPVEFEGIVTSVRFRKDYFYILRVAPVEELVVPKEYALQAGNRLQEVMVKGNLTVNPGKNLRLLIRGSWSWSDKHGLQIKADWMSPILTLDDHAAEKFLIQTTDKIGKKTATQFADLCQKKFGPGWAARLVENPDLILTLDFPEAKKQAIYQTFSTRTVSLEIQKILAAVGISQTWANRILDRFGPQGKEILLNDPYRLMEVSGFGFMRADQVAQMHGIPKDSPFRIRGALLHAIQEDMVSGHVYSVRESLIQHAALLCEVDESMVVPVLDKLGELMQGQIVHQSLDGRDVWYLRRLWMAEQIVAEHLSRLAVKPPLNTAKNISKILPECEKRLGLELTEKQRQAVINAIVNRVSILCGLPGTGKTTTLRCLIEVCNQLCIPFQMAAPTGRAVRRMEEVTGVEGKTIHRLLETKTERRGFRYDAYNRLPAALYIIDESSMIDIELAAALVQALPDDARIVFVGDPNQLPSVGPGQFFRDLIECGLFPTVSLNRIFRQAKNSQIVVGAHRILNGETPFFMEYSPGCLAGSKEVFFVIPDMREGKNGKPTADEDSTRDYLKMVLHELTHLCHEDFAENIQILTPVRRGPLGTESLNLWLRELYFKHPARRNNPSGEVCGRIWRVGDRVMVTRNNYARGVFNGEIGIIREVGSESLIIDFPTERIEFLPEDIRDLDLAYAMTIHKSQGSEFDAVVIICHKSHYMMLFRNLFYTALTRAKKKVIFIGDRAALWMAVKNTKSLDRNSSLQKVLLEACHEKEAVNG